MTLNGAQENIFICAETALYRLIFNMTLVKNFALVDVLMKVLNAQELIDHIVSETNSYSGQRGFNFLKNHDDELKADCMFLSCHVRVSE